MMLVALISKESSQNVIKILKAFCAQKFRIYKLNIAMRT